MLGAIAGDMIGSPYEGYPIKHKDFDLLVSAFTDDTVLTLAVAHAILNKSSYAASIKSFARKYHHLPYGGSFRQWIWARDNEPYYSYGNGSAMRVSPVGFAFNSIEDVLQEAKKSAEVTHNHPEGIKGALATALAIFRAREGVGKESIRSEISSRFGYNLERTVDEIRPEYRFDVTCQGSVPESIIAFLDSDSWEDAIRNAVSLGGDSDTMACIAGGIAQAYYKHIPRNIVSDVLRKLPGEFRDIMIQFSDRFRC
jgi:ADP-ribosylglycohydrolase